MLEATATLAMLGFFIASMTGVAATVFYFINELRRARLDEAIIQALSKGQYPRANKRVHNQRLRAVRKHEAHDDKARN